MSAAADSRFTEDEQRILIFSLLKTRAGRGATEEELAKVAEWADMARLNSTLLDMVLDNELVIDFDADGKIAFQAAEAKP